MAIRSAFDRNLIVMALKNESQCRFENSGLQPFYCGIGLVKAAYSLTQKLSQVLCDPNIKEKPNLIINLGTAGSFQHQQRELVEVSAFVQRNHFLPAEKTKIELTTLTTLPKVICGSADTIESTSPIISSYYDIMDMEGYALAFVCQKFKIPFVSIKYISDNSNENTVHDWKINLSDAAEKLESFYKMFFIKN